MQNSYPCCISMFGTTLISNINILQRTIPEIGKKVTLNTFDLELRSCTTGLMQYLSLVDINLTPLIISKSHKNTSFEELVDAGKEKTFETIESVMHMTNRFIAYPGELINRQKNHLELKAMNFDMAFSDLHDNILQCQNKYDINIPITKLSENPNINIQWASNWMTRIWKNKDSSSMSSQNFIAKLQSGIPVDVSKNEDQWDIIC